MNKYKNRYKSGLRNCWGKSAVPCPFGLFTIYKIRPAENRLYIRIFSCRKVSSKCHSFAVNTAYGRVLSEVKDEFKFVNYKFKLFKFTTSFAWKLDKNCKWVMNDTLFPSSEPRYVCQDTKMDAFKNNVPDKGILNWSL